jgi:uncharacterized membrane protein
MTTLFRIFRLLSIVTWVGGLIFFAFILAPTAFSVLPSRHEAGTIVAATLHLLNLIGWLCGVLFVVATGLLAALESAGLQSRKPLRIAIAQILLIVGMMAATDYVQLKIVPAMERDRIAAGGDIDAAPSTNPARLDFERLHPISEKVEGTALLLGLGIVILMGFERPVPTARPSA